MIVFPTKVKEIDTKIRTDIQRNVTGSNPFLKNSYLGAIASALSFRINDFYLQLKELVKQLFIETAEAEYLKMFGAWFGVTINPATQASGFVVATGTAGSVVAIGETLQSSDGLEYTTLTTGTISVVTFAVTSITRSGTTATVVTPSAHNLASGITVTIAGAAQTDYNGAVVITVLSATSFTFSVANSPATPATGTITGVATYAYIEVEAVDFGADTNQLSGTILNFTSPISGVDSSATVDFNELSGGTDEEVDPDYRIRIKERVQNPVALFNVAAITAIAKTVSGVTRVFVEEATPAAGQVTVYFVRDNDVNIIPSSGEVDTVKTAILTIKPAHTEDDDVIVSDPTAVTTNYSFSAISPSTPTMEDAIATSLQELYSNLDVGVTVPEDAYRSAIFKTVDRETGDSLVSFTLTTPSGDITIASGEIPVLGTVTF